MNHSDLHGTYLLKSFTIEFANGEMAGQSVSWGKDPHGILIYAPTGHMSVSINRQIEHVEEQSELENVFDSFLFYAGTYSVEGNTILHLVTEATNPSRVGKDLIRVFEWKGNQLHLKTPMESFGQATLVWEKVSV